MCINLKWRAKFQVYRLHIRDSDWLDFMHFSGYKYKIRLVSILRKREDQPLISISTILKFSALIVLLQWSAFILIQWRGLKIGFLTSFYQNTSLQVNKEKELIDILLFHMFKCTHAVLKLGRNQKWIRKSSSLYDTTTTVLFRNKKGLTDHTKSVHSREFICNICSKICKRKVN